MNDRFSRNAASLTGPSNHGFAMTPSDTLDLPELTRAIYIGTGGSLTVRLASGQSLTFAGVAAGTILPLRIDRVFASGTSASGLVGLV